jgi:hypothetical protein
MEQNYYMNSSLPDQFVISFLMYSVYYFSVYLS